jgi:hypothetical protein
MRSRFIRQRARAHASNRRRESENSRRRDNGEASRAKGALDLLQGTFTNAAIADPHSNSSAKQYRGSFDPFRMYQFL